MLLIAKSEYHKSIDKNNVEFYAKIYSSKVDYEGSKAYLTTVVDVTEYMVEDDEL